MNINNKQKHAHYPVLDALRGCAAIFVAQRHMAGDFWAGHGFYRTYLAVDLFFLLSGFVIAAAYSNRLESGQLTPNRFMLIRWIRLYPMYFLATTLAILAVIPSIGAAVSKGGHVWAALGLTSIATFMFLPSHWLGGIFLFSLNFSFWSLFYELIINAGYACVAKLLNNFRLAIIILGALILVITLALKMDTDINDGWGWGWGWAWVHVFMGVARSMFGIGAGILLYRMRHRLAQALRVEAGGHAMLGIGIPLLAMLLMATPSIGVFDVPFDIFVCAVLFPLAVFLATFVNWTNGWFLLICSALGSISYPIYVLHIPISQLIKTFTPTLGETYPVTSGLAVLVFLMALSYVAEKVYEIPVRRWLNQRLLGPSRVMAEQPNNEIVVVK
ncbi:MAG: hypothetical protein RIR09_2122 [Pseudomonadota bacterium]